MGIRLLIVDDHQLVRDGLRLTLEGSDVTVVAEAADGHEAFKVVLDHLVDVALVDIRMPRADGFVFLEALSEAKLKMPVVLMHTADEGTRSAMRCRELGARGLVLKGHERTILLDAIRRVHAGEQLWDIDASSCGRT